MTGVNMDKKYSAIIKEYYNEVREAYELGNVESSYNPPIIKMITEFGCAARDLSGQRIGKRGENIDIKLWHNESEVTEIEPFGGIEVKKIGGIDERAKSQIIIDSQKKNEQNREVTIIKRFIGKASKNLNKMQGM